MDGTTNRAGEARRNVAASCQIMEKLLPWPQRERRDRGSEKSSLLGLDRSLVRMKTAIETDIQTRRMNCPTSKWPCVFWLGGVANKGNRNRSEALKAEAEREPLPAPTRNDSYKASRQRQSRAASKRRQKPFAGADGERGQNRASRSSRKQKNQTRLGLH